MSGSLNALGGAATDFGAGIAGVSPAPKPPTQTSAAPATEKLAPAPVRGPDGKFPGDATAPAAAPVGAVAPAEPITSLRSLKLEQMRVSQGDQLNPVYALRQSTPPETVVPATPASAPTNANLPLAEGPRAFRSDTIRQGVEPGVQMNLGDGIFATSSGLNKDGRLDTFTGVGKDYNADSARFGPDPNGADRARQDAIVEQNLQAKPREQRGPRMPEFRSNERDINARFDQLAKEAQRNFSSPRAAGNLTKALERIEASRMQALSQDADNITRQQQAAMQFQSDQSRDALTERDLSQRAAQAARADETDRLGIEAQNARAAETAAATAQFKGMDLKQKEWATLVRNKQFYGDFDEFLAEDGLKNGGFGGDYVNAKEAKAIAQSINKQVQATFGAGAGENADPEAANAILANQQLMYGSPEAAVQTQGRAIAAVAKALGRHDLGEFVGFVDSTAADRRGSADTIYRKVLDTLQGDEKALQFTAPDGTPIYVAQDALPPYATRHFIALQKMQEERKAKKKERN